MALTKITNSAIADDIGLGGNPTTSTQTAGDSTTRIATTAFVSTAVANLVDSAPATLNTLNELAAAIGDNATFSSTMTTSIASKLPLAGGTLTGNLNLGDNVRARFGLDSDLQIYHDGSNSIISDEGTGELRLRGSSYVKIMDTNDEVGLQFRTNGAVTLYHNNIAKFETTSTGIDVTGNVDLPDNGKILLGASDDLEIYHDGTNSYIADRGTGNLRLEGTNIALNNQASNKTYLLATDGGSVQLRHNDLTKIETTTTGIDVTGNIGVTGTVDGIDIAARDAVLTSTTTTAGAALPKAGGTMTGNIQLNNNIELRTLDTGGNARTIVRANSSNELEFGWSANAPVKFMGGGSYTERMRIHTNGNIAINHTSAPHTLTVKGTISRLNSSGIQVTNLQTNNDNGQIAILNSGGVQKVLIDSNGGSTFNGGAVYFTGGNVGIGTTGPAQKLHVVGSAIIDGGTGVASTGVLNVRQSGDTLNNGIALTSSHATSHRIWKDSTGKLNFGPTSLPSAFVQDLTGKIGIGTASPLHKLAIGGNSTQTLKSTVAITDMTNGASLSLRGQAPTIFFDSTSAGIPTILMDGRGIEFKDGTLDSQGNVDVKIDATGNVGIGTAAPIEKLDVSGYQGISVNANYAHMGSTVSGAMAIFGHNIKSDSGNNIIKSANNGYHSSMIKMYYNEGITFHATAGTQSAGADFYNISGTTNELMRLTNDGNLGIGTPSPESLLTIQNDDAGIRLRSNTTTAKGLTLRYNHAGNFGQLLVDHQGNNQLAMKYYALSHSFGRSDSDVNVIMDDSGRLLVGSTTTDASTSERFLVKSTGGEHSRFVNSSDTYSTVYIKNTSTTANTNQPFLTFQDTGGNRGNFGLRYSTAQLFIQGHGGVGIAGGSGFTQDPDLFVNSSGNIGIGTNNPLRSLDVRHSLSIFGTGGYTELMLRSRAGTAQNLGAFHLAIRGDVGGNNDDLKFLRFTGGNSPSYAGIALQIQNSTGNVGIGTSSPQAKLHVDGTTIFDTATGSQPVYFTRLGNINESLKIHCDDRGAVFESIQDETADTYGNFIFAMDAGVTEPYFDVRKGSADSASIFRVDGGGNVGIGTQSPFSRLQTGGHTFSGGNGMHADARVGISNHGNLTGLMLASTYNDAAHPEYGLVFVQGPSTSSYNVWSVSPDGPAKGDSLNFHYQAQSTNIHSPSNAKVVFDGNGNIAFGGNLHFRTAQDGSFIGPLNTSDLRLAADGNHIFQTYVGGWGTRMEIRDNGIRFPAGDYGVHTTQEHYSNPSSPGSFSTATNTAYTSSTQYWPDQGEKQICVINARAFTKYIHIKTNLTANNIMFYFRTKGYFYSYGMEEQLVGGYTYYSGGNMILSKSNETVAGNTHTGDTYRASDGSLVLKMHVNHTGYTEGKMLVFFHAHAPSTTSAITVTAVTQKDDGTNAF